MKQRRRIYYSESQQALMWERWRKGESLQHIAQLFDRNHSSVQGILAQTGGIQPAPRQRSRLALTLAEREEISRGLVAGDSICAMVHTTVYTEADGACVGVKLSAAVSARSSNWRTVSASKTVNSGKVALNLGGKRMSDCLTRSWAQ
ncbi:hypothetical protein OKW35_005299 [Paraburkholderia sp. MM5477-R1]